MSTTSTAIRLPTLVGCRNLRKILPCGENGKWPRGSIFAFWEIIKVGKIYIRQVEGICDRAPSIESTTELALRFADVFDVAKSMFDPISRRKFNSKLCLRQISLGTALDVRAAILTLGNRGMCVNRRRRH